MLTREWLQLASNSPFEIHIYNQTIKSLTTNMSKAIKIDYMNYEIYITTPVPGEALTTVQYIELILLI
jgi:hypothetical protein